MNTKDQKIAKLHSIYFNLNEEGLGNSEILEAFMLIDDLRSTHLGYDDSVSVRNREEDIANLISQNPFFDDFMNYAREEVIRDDEVSSLQLRAIVIICNVLSRIFLEQNRHLDACDVNSLANRCLTMIYAILKELK